MELNLGFDELKQFLDDKVEEFNQPSFIKDDPIQIPHRYEKKEDIEIAGFMVAMISWGKREMILKSSNRMMELMDNSPAQFIQNHTEKDLDSITKFVHRTFNLDDFKFFVSSLRNIYTNHGGLEAAFSNGWNGEETVFNAISNFNDVFFENCDMKFRTRKHVANPRKGSAAKRINMYLRWMIRNDQRNVDFGLWKSIPSSVLSCPLDVHTANVGRMLGFIKRNQNDWKTVCELDTALRRMDAKDPVKYDFALFGLGAIEGWK